MKLSPWQLHINEIIFIYSIGFIYLLIFWLQEDWVLCRVFHKSKGENSENLSPQFIYESVANNNASSFTPSAASPPTADCRMINMPFGYHQQQHISSSAPGSYRNHNNQSSNSMLNLLQFPTSLDQKNNNKNQSNDIISSKSNDDDYGFIWEMEMDLQENCCSLENDDNNGGVASNLEDDMRFELDNSMVFLWKICIVLEIKHSLSLYESTPFVDCDLLFVRCLALRDKLFMFRLIEYMLEDCVCVYYINTLVFNVLFFLEDINKHYYSTSSICTN